MPPRALRRRKALRRGAKFRRAGRIVWRPDPTDTALDRLARQVVMLRDDWTCQRCGTRYRPGDRGIQWAHLVTRSRKRTRWLPEAAVALCTGCHLFLDSHPHEKISFAVGCLGQDGFEALRWRSLNGPKPDRALVRLHLKAELAQLKARHTTPDLPDSRNIPPVTTRSVP